MYNRCLVIQEGIDKPLFVRQSQPILFLSPFSFCKKQIINKWNKKIAISLPIDDVGANFISTYDAVILIKDDLLKIELFLC